MKKWKWRAEIRTVEFVKKYFRHIILKKTKKRQKIQEIDQEKDFEDEFAREN